MDPKDDCRQLNNDLHWLLNFIPHPMTRNFSNYHCAFQRHRACFVRVINNCRKIHRCFCSKFCSFREMIAMIWLQLCRRIWTPRKSIRLETGKPNYSAPRTVRIGRQRHWTHTRLRCVAKRKRNREQTKKSDNWPELSRTSSALSNKLVLLCIVILLKCRARWQLPTVTDLSKHWRLYYCCPWKRRTNQCIMKKRYVALDQTVSFIFFGRAKFRIHERANF